MKKYYCPFCMSYLDFEEVEFGIDETKELKLICSRCLQNHKYNVYLKETEIFEEEED